MSWMLRPQLFIFNAERVPQVHEVGDDDTLVLLRGEFLRQQTLADAALDVRDLRLNQRAHTIAIFPLKGLSSFLLDVSGDLVMPACFRLAMHNGVSGRRDDGCDACL
jgi:hypothetical protein